MNQTDRERKSFNINRAVMEQAGRDAIFDHCIKFELWNLSESEIAIDLITCIIKACSDCQEKQEIKNALDIMACKLDAQS